jgi:hypothetical protein
LGAAKVGGPFEDVTDRDPAGRARVIRPEVLLAAHIAGCATRILRVGGCARERGRPAAARVTGTEDGGAPSTRNRVRAGKQLGCHLRKRGLVLRRRGVDIDET